MADKTSITLEMVQAAYEAVGGKDKAIRHDYFTENYDHEAKKASPKCCGLAAIYLENNNGHLEVVNNGLSHLSEDILQELEKCPDDIIPNYISKKYGVSRDYIDGWMMGFDDGGQEAQTKALKSIERRFHGSVDSHAESQAEWQRGFDTGKRIGDVIFARECAACGTKDRDWWRPDPLDENNWLCGWCIAGEDAEEPDDGFKEE
jgi:hypothetical protein